MTAEFTDVSETQSSEPLSSERFVREASLVDSTGVIGETDGGLAIEDISQISLFLSLLIIYFFYVYFFFFLKQRT